MQEEFENIPVDELEDKEQEEQPVDNDVQEDLFSERLDSIAEGVSSIDEKVDGVSGNVNELLSASDRDGATATDYTAQITELHTDLEELKELEAFNGLVLVLVCAVLFLSVGVEIGKSVVKWLRFGNG